MGPAEQRALIAITDPLESQSKFSESGRLEAQELEQVNDRPGRSPGRIRHSLERDLVTHLHLDPHIFDAKPLARTTQASIAKQGWSTLV
jgi:hypothetical protein